METGSLLNEIESFKVTVFYISKVIFLKNIIFLRIDLNENFLCIKDKIKY